MKNKKFFKLIVVNYNNYIYIKKCLDSIKNQTFKDFICIIVDDVSSDKSPDIAKIYEKRYPEQFKFIQLTTKGYPGGARNTALQFDIESEYTWFIDSDDYLYDNNVLNEMYKCITLNKKPDIIRCSYITIENDSNGNISHKLNIEKNDINYILNSGLAPWKTCHKSNIKIQFPENCLIEDVLYGLKLFDKIDITNIPVVQKPCYVYNRMSITSLWNNPNNTKNSFFYYSQLKLIKDLINANFNTEYCDKYTKKEIEKLKNSLKITFNGGRLANQLYYCLQSYLSNIKYSITPYDDKIFNTLKLLGCDTLISNEFTNCHIDSYCQNINKDFTIEEISNFITNILLTSELFKNYSLKEDSVAIHIRNGDYLNPKLNHYHDCFNRLQYIIDSCEKFKYKFPYISKIVIFSDDCNLCKKLYHFTFQKYFSTIVYNDGYSYQQDFIELSTYKYKILWNSTFSYWSSFISNVIYNNSEECIFVPDIFTKDENALTRCNPKWNFIKTIQII